MQPKLTEHGMCCIQNKQILTKSHVELEDNSNVVIEFDIASKKSFETLRPSS